MNQRNPARREEQEHEGYGHAVYRSWCAAYVEGRGVGGRKEANNPNGSFFCCFLTQETADTFPILICLDNRHGQTGVTCCERKGSTAFFTRLIVDLIKDPDLRRIILKCQNEFEYESVSRCDDSLMCWSVCERNEKMQNSQNFL